jgi:hypothetical protein
VGVGSIVRINFTHQRCRHLVKNWKHQCRLFCQPDCKSWVVLTQICEYYFEALLVVLAHVMDFVFINKVVRLVPEHSQKAVKLSVNEFYDIGSLEPSRQWSFHIFKIKHLLHLVIFPIIRISILLHKLSHSFLSDFIMNQVVIAIIIFVFHQSSSSPLSHGHFSSLLLVEFLLDGYSFIDVEFVLVRIIKPVTFIPV